MIRIENLTVKYNSNGKSSRSGSSHGIGIGIGIGIDKTKSKSEANNNGIDQNNDNCARNENEIVALENININIEGGAIYTIIGPSGCGKSTLLNVLAGIQREYSGTVLINGEKVDPKKNNIGMVFQNYGLLPWKNVYDNAVMGLKIKGFPNYEYASDILNRLQLGKLLKKYPKELSGGERQRVALARAFALKPDILLMDEQFSALDAITREEMQEIFLDIWKEHSVTTLFITHSVEEALYLGEKVVVLTPSPGRIYKTIDNSVFGISNTRLNEEYYRKSIELRKIIEKGWVK